MSMNKKMLATAVAGALYMVATSASAQVVLNANGGDSVKYAQEMVKPTAGLTLTGVTANQMRVALGYNFSGGEVRYGRVECSSNISFGTGASVASNQADAAGASTTEGAVNYTNAGGGTNNAIYFSLTDAGAVTTADDILTVSSGYILRDSNPVTCSFSLYDQPSQAQSGGATGRIVFVSDTFLQSVPSFTFTTQPGQAIANVEATNGAYTAFLGTNQIGTFNLALATTVPLNATGNPITLGDIFAAGTSLRVEGDLAAGDVELCGSTDFTTDATDTFANLTIGATAYSNQGVCFLANGSAIAEGSYDIRLNPVANSGFSVSPIVRDLGDIVRNGTQLQAPLVHVTSDYVSRIALTNTGIVARSFTIRVIGEAGSGRTLGTTSGTIPAEGTVVVPLNQVITAFTAGAPRATVIVTVAAPNNQIQGVYQVVKADTGSMSNTVMVRPGMN